MKTQLTIVVVILVSIAIMGFKYNFSPQDNEFKIEATYFGVTIDDQFEFLNDDDEYIYFDNVKDNIKIDLNDEKYIDSRFMINWIESESEIKNESGEPTGEMQIHKTITKLKIM